MRGWDQGLGLRSGLGFGLGSGIRIRVGVGVRGSGSGEGLEVGDRPTLERVDVATRRSALAAAVPLLAQQRERVAR